MQKKGVKAFAAVVTVGVLVIAIAGAYMAGSPAKVRMESLDARRVSDLQSISYGIESYYRLEGALPANLEALKSTRDVYVSSIIDPESFAPYAYTRVSTDEYQLCATFSLPAPEASKGNADYVYEYPIYDYGTNFWNHDAGYKCYSLEIRPDPYPPVKPIMTEPIRIQE